MLELSQIWAGLSIGLAGLWVAVWQGILIYKAMEIIGKNPNLSMFYLTTTILWIALLESAAIYGFIIAFQILWGVVGDPVTAIGCGTAVGLAGLWVGIGEWVMLSWAFDAMNKDPENRWRIMTYMILFLALIESAAIYGLIVAFQILSAADISGLAAVWSGLAIWFAGLWVGVGEWILAKRAIELMAEEKKCISLLLPMSILGIALVESAAIYGLIVAFQIINTVFLDPMIAVWAWLAIWLAGLWVGIGEGCMVAKALEAMTVDEKNKSKLITFMVLFIALIESAAIYGLVVAFQILSSEIAWLTAVWAWLAIWLAGLWVGVGEWKLSSKSIEVMARRPKYSSFFLTITILGIALVESAAIYWLVVAFQIIGVEWLIGVSAVAAWVAIGFAALWAWIGEGVLVSGCIAAMNRNPHNKTKDLTFMVLFVALVEVIAIYGLIIAFQILR